MSFVAELEPKPLWQHFDEILKIPRPSKNEERMRRYVLGVAERHGLEHRTDAAGNVVVKKPASAGREGAPTVILQGHLDMVQEKNSDVDHDWASDPIRPRRDGEYLKATGTTLGSDNGIGVAAALAVMEADDLVHGPLELLFTIDEETGLTGASELAGDMLEGRLLINMDSEEEGVLTVGCAGGLNTQLTLPVADAPAPADAAALELKLAGLKGGHSGVDIHLQRGNAIRLLARALHAVSEGGVPFDLASLAGGNAHNAIPREAKATVLVAPDHRQAFEARFQEEMEAIRAEYRPAEPDMTVAVAPAASPGKVLDATSARRVLALLTGLPHGVQSMSYDIPDLVETSTNLATVTRGNGNLGVLMSSRSSVASALQGITQRIHAIAALAGAAAEDSGGYPGWKPDMDSRLLHVVRQLHHDVLGTDPKITAIHAGLECGIIGEKYPGMDMISFGPQIEFPHSPDERVRIHTVPDFYKLLTATLAKLAD